jgi:hypothetical protein
MAESRRLKRVLVSVDLVLDFLRRVREDDGTSLPNDARALRVFTNSECDGFEFIVASESFSPIDEGETIPPLEIKARKK